MRWSCGKMGDEKLSKRADKMHFKRPTVSGSSNARCFGSVTTGSV